MMIKQFVIFTTIDRDSDEWNGLSCTLVRIVNQSGAHRRRSGNTPPLRLIVDGRELFLTSVSGVKART